MIWSSRELTTSWKNIDVLVNAAGVTHYSLLVATKPELVDEIVRTNLMGTLWACQIMVKNMMRRKRGQQGGLTI